MSLLKKIFLIRYRSKASATATIWKDGVHTDFNDSIRDVMVRFWPVLNFSETKINEAPNTILNKVHISSLNVMILKWEYITGKKILKTNLNALKEVLQKEPKKIKRVQAQEH